jgi:hypothetical protein
MQTRTAVPSQPETATQNLRYAVSRQRDQVRVRWRGSARTLRYHSRVSRRFDPVIRSEPGFSIFPRELLLVAGLNSFRTTVWITIVLEFGSATWTEIELRDRDEMNLRIKVAAVFQIICREFRVLCSQR